MFYQIENENIIAVVSDLGATLVKFIDKNTDTDLVLGYNNEEDYIKYADANIGCSVGRNANRIAKAKFTLNGKEYFLTPNNNGNSLHGGGINGFGFKNWKVKEKSNDSITFTYISKDFEEGFPGNLEVEVTYKIDLDSLIWSYTGKCDQDTVLNMTNHSYFNLGEDSALNCNLQIFTDKYSPVDDNALTLDKVVNVKDSPFDFTNKVNVKDNLKRLENGIDNNYVWETLSEKKMVSFSNESLTLNVYSDLPDMHLYTSQYLGGQNGKYDRVYKSYDGICFEAQYYPNAINYEGFIKPILKKYEVKTHYIRYQINH